METMNIHELEELEFQNDSLRTNLRNKMLDYILSMHDYMKDTMAQYLKAYNNPVQVATNLDEEAYFLTMPKEIKEKSTISLSGASAFMLKKIKTADLDSYLHGVPAEFFAHCKMVYSSENGPAMAVTDPYRTVTICFPYHSLDDIRQLAGKYVLIRTLIKNGIFLGYDYQIFAEALSQKIL